MFNDDQIQNEFFHGIVEFLAEKKISPENAIEYISNFLLIFCKDAGISSKEFKENLEEMIEVYNKEEEALEEIEESDNG